MAATKKDQMLRKVRGLLAKAEDPACTPEEAEAFSRKAEELIAAYAIDMALVEERRARGRGKPTTREVASEANYRKPFGQLLIEISAALGCKPIWGHKQKLITVVGFESDLDLVETLYGSLLLQATNAMVHEAKRVGYRGDDLWRFKVSFITGFALRVGKRLREMYRDQAEASGTGTALVLRDRRQDVEEEFARLFPDTRKVNGPNVRDPLAFRAGGQAADRADIGGKRVGGTRREIA